MKFAPWVITIVVFLLVFEFTAFDEDIQEQLIVTHSHAENATALNEQILSFFSGGTLPDMTEEEASHMYDVRFLNWLVIGIISILLVSCFWIPWKELQMIDFVWPLGTFAFIGATAWFFPDMLFNIFHVLFFPQGNYTFPQDSFLITLYPASYFYALFYAVLWRFVIVVAAGFGVWWYARRS